MRNDGGGGGVSENNRSGEGPRGGVLPHLRLLDATKTEDRKSLGTIKVSRRVCESAVKTGHFSNGMMAAHELCKLLSLRQAMHPVNDNHGREQGSRGTEHRDICVRIGNVRTAVAAWMPFSALYQSSPLNPNSRRPLLAWIHCWECSRLRVRPEGNRNTCSLKKEHSSRCLRFKIKVTWR